MKLEKNIEDEVVKWCDNQGWLCLKVLIKGRRGFPDRLIVAPHGIVAFLELKTSKGTLSIHQIEQYGSIYNLGHRVGVCYSTVDAVEFLEQVKSKVDEIKHLHD